MTKEFVANLFKGGFNKRNIILAAFTDKTILGPSKSQLNLRTSRKQTYGPSPVSSDEILD